MDEITDVQINRAVHEKVMGECWHNFAILTICPVCDLCGEHVEQVTQDEYGIYCPSRRDYCNDLNAVALAEAKVSEVQKLGYLAALGGCCQDPDLDDWWNVTTATARQRSIAVLNSFEVTL